MISTFKCCCSSNLIQDRLLEEGFLLASEMETIVQVPPVEAHVDEVLPEQGNLSKWSTCFILTSSPLTFFQCGQSNGASTSYRLIRDVLTWKT